MLPGRKSAAGVQPWLLGALFSFVARAVCDTNAVVHWEFEPESWKQDTGSLARSGENKDLFWPDGHPSIVRDSLFCAEGDGCAYFSERPLKIKKRLELYGKSNGLSIGMWYKREGKQRDWARILRIGDCDRDDHDPTRIAIMVDADGDGRKVKFDLGEDRSAVARTVTDNCFNTNDWIHLVWSMHKNHGWKIWCNGNKVFDDDRGTDDNRDMCPNMKCDDSRVGNRHDEERPFKGWIDDIRIYTNDVRSASEALAGAYLRYRWRFEAGDFWDDSLPRDADLERSMCLAPERVADASKCAVGRGCAYFDGQSCFHVGETDLRGGGRGMTVSLWYKRDGSQREHARLLSFRDCDKASGYGADRLEIEVNYDGDANRVKFSNEETSTVLSRAVFGDDEWIHLIWTMHKDKGWKIWVNEELESTQSGESKDYVIDAKCKDNALGNRLEDNGDRAFKGWMDEVLIVEGWLEELREGSFSRFFHFAFDRSDFNDDAVFLAADLDTVRAGGSQSSGPTLASAGQCKYRGCAYYAAAAHQIEDLTYRTRISELSFAMWFRASGAQAQYARLWDFAGEWSADNDVRVEFRSEEGRSLRLYNRNHQADIYSVDIENGEWCHLAWTMGQAGWRVWVNGAMRYEWSGRAVPGAAWKEMYVGNHWSEGRQFKGWVDEFYALPQLYPSAAHFQLYFFFAFEAPWLSSDSSPANKHLEKRVGSVGSKGERDCPMFGCAHFDGDESFQLENKPRVVLRGSEHGTTLMVWFRRTQSNLPQDARILDLSGGGGVVSGPVSSLRIKLRGSGDSFNKEVTRFELGGGHSTNLRHDEFDSDRWNLLVWHMSRGGWRIYLNGALEYQKLVDSSASMVPDFEVTNSAVGSDLGNNKEFEGLMDDLKMYEGVVHHWHGALLVHYKFDSWAPLVDSGLHRKHLVVEHGSVKARSDCKDGECVLLEGDRLRLPSISVMGHPDYRGVTVAVWYRKVGPQAGYARLLEMRGGGYSGSTTGIRLMFHPEWDALQLELVGGHSMKVSAPIINSDSWVHVVWAMSQQGWRVHINGDLRGEWAGTSIPHAELNNNVIGDQPGGGRACRAIIDELQIFSMPIRDVADFYKIFHFKFDKGEELTDSSPSGLHLTAAGGPAAQRRTGGKNCQHEGCVQIVAGEHRPMTIASKVKIHGTRNGLTLSMYYNRDGAMARDVPLIDCHGKDISGGPDGFAVYVNAGNDPDRVKFQVHGGKNQVLTHGGFDSGSWQHVVWAMSTDRWMVWRNGQLLLDWRKAQSGMVPDFEVHTCAIGYTRDLQTSRKFDGKVDDFQLHNIFIEDIHRFVQQLYLPFQRSDKLADASLNGLTLSEVRGEVAAKGRNECRSGDCVYLSGRVLRLPTMNLRDNSPLTISLWFKRHGNQETYARLLHLEGEARDGRAPADLRIEVASGGNQDSIKFALDNGNNGHETVQTRNWFSDQIWTHLMWEMHNGGWSIWANGDLIYEWASGNNGWAIPDFTATKNFIGAKNTNLDANFRGWVDEVRITRKHYGDARLFSQLWHFPLAVSAASAVTSDLSFHGNHLLQPTPGRPGLGSCMYRVCRGVLFTGASSRLDFGGGVDVHSHPNGMSISLWFRRRGATAGNGARLLQVSGTAFRGSVRRIDVLWPLKAEQQRLRFQMQGGTSRDVVDAEFASWRWVQLIWTMGNGNWKIWANGRKVLDKSGSLANFDTTSGFIGSSLFRGWIYNVEAYSIRLNAASLGSLCHNGQQDPGESGVDCGPESGCGRACPRCPGGWTAFQGSCYKLLQANATKAEAQAECDSVNFRHLEQNSRLPAAHLPIPETSHASNHVLASFGPTWLAAGRVGEEMQWEDLQRGAAPPTGVSVADDGSDCLAVLAEDRWGSVDCSGELPAVCEMTMDGSCGDGIKNQDETGVDCGGTLCGPCPPECPAGFVAFDAKKCYGFFGKATFSAAKTQCHSLGGQLPHPASWDESYFVHAQLGSAWIGVNPRLHPFINEFEWTNGREAHEPAGVAFVDTQQHTCVRTAEREGFTSGVWTDAACSSKLRVACELPAWSWGGAPEPCTEAPRRDGKCWCRGEGGIMGGCTRLDLTRLGLRKLEGWMLEGTPLLRELDVGENKIREVPKHFFFGKDRILRLSLYNNRIRQIEECAFCGLSRLESLDLSGNEITAASFTVQSFQELPVLKTLDLSYNKISELPERAFDGVFDGLKILRLDHNAMHELKNGSFFGLKTEGLTLNNNRMRTMHYDAFKPQIGEEQLGIQFLWMHDNLVEWHSVGVYLPLQYLQLLTLLGNPLSCIPAVGKYVTSTDYAVLTMPVCLPKGCGRNLIDEGTIHVAEAVNELTARRIHYQSAEWVVQASRPDMCTCLDGMLLEHDLWAVDPVHPHIRWWCTHEAHMFVLGAHPPSWEYLRDSQCRVCPTCSCSDGLQNQFEDGIDCGGPCGVACPTCSDGIQNGGELGVDCEGPLSGPVGARGCKATCPTCSDGIRNWGEEQVDCGGPNCPPCPSCSDGYKNQAEEGVDCGGVPRPEHLEWDKCADENHICACTGRVRFGADEQFAYHEVDGSIECKASAFGNRFQTGFVSEWFKWGNTLNVARLPQTPQFTTVQATVNYHGPAPVEIGVNRLAARWTGQFEVKPDAVGEYKFRVRVADGVRLRVQETIVIDKWKKQGATWYSGSFSVATPGWYTVELEYFEFSGVSLVDLRWQPPGESEHRMGAWLKFPVRSSGFLSEWFNYHHASEPLPPVPEYALVQRTIAVADSPPSVERILQVGTSENKEYAVRWTGQFDVDASALGEYAFRARVADGVRLWVDGELLIDEWRQQDERDFTATFSVTAVGSFQLEVEHFELSGLQRAQLFWTPPGSAEHLVGTDGRHPFTPAARRPVEAAGFLSEWFAYPQHQQPLPSTPAHTMVQPVVSHRSSPPGAVGLAATNFAVRWTARFHVGRGARGAYEFAVRVDDGARLWVADTLLVDQWSGQHTAEYKATLFIAEEGWNTVVLEYFQGAGDAWADLYWTPPGGSTHLMGADPAYPVTAGAAQQCHCERAVPEECDGPEWMCGVCDAACPTCSSKYGAGWHSYGWTTCYKALGKSERHGAAESQCAAIGARLPIITSRAESLQVSRWNDDKDFWLGMTRWGVDGNWDDMRWVDSSKVVPVNNIEADFTADKDKACVKVRDDGEEWESDKCSDHLRVVCQRSLYETCVDGQQNQGEEGIDCGGPCAACPPAPECHPAWTRFGTSCFRSDGVRGSWEEAMEYCARAYGPSAHLPIVTSRMETDFLHGQYRDSWIGLRRKPAIWKSKDLNDYHWAMSGMGAEDVPDMNFFDLILDFDDDQEDACVHVSSGNRWSNRDPCRDAKSIVCEYELHPSCADSIHNGDERGVDCGGACQPCQCENGVQDLGEDGVDCGGLLCPSCDAACPFNASETQSQHNGLDLAPGTKCYFAFEEDTLWADWSGNGNVLSDYGAGREPSSAPSTQCRVGSCAYFDGNDAFRVPAFQYDAQNGVSVAFWYKMDGRPDRYDRVFAIEGSQDIRLEVRASDDDEVKIVTDTDFRDKQLRDSVLGIGIWIHMAIVLGQSSSRIYVNGEVEATGSKLRGDLAESISSFVIGASSSGGNGFKGWMDEFTFAAGELSQAQVQKMVSLYVPDFTSLRTVFFFEFDQGGLFADESANGYTLSAYGEAPSLSSGRVGASARFDGSNDGLQVPSFQFDATNGISIALWYQMDGTPERDTRLFCFSGSTFIGLRLRSSDRDQVQITTNTAFGTVQIRHDKFEDRGRWIHLAIVLGKSGSQVFVDGQVVLHRAGWAGSATEAITTAVIGAPCGSGRRFDGRIDQFIFVEGELSPQVVQELAAGDADSIPLGGALPSGGMGAPQAAEGPVLARDCSALNCSDMAWNLGEEGVDCGAACGTACPSCDVLGGWRLSPDGLSCMRAFPEVGGVSYQGAQAVCRGAGARLPVVWSTEESNMVYELSGGQSTWLGLRRDTESERGPITEFRWEQGQPGWLMSDVVITVNAGQQCMRADEQPQRWSTDDCEGENQVVCERPLHPTCSDGVRNGEELDVDCGGPCSECACPVGRQEIDGVCYLPCPEGWAVHGTSCYLKLPTRESWGEGKRKCEEAASGAHLPIVTTAEESEAVREAAGGDAWLGVQANPDSKSRQMRAYTWLDWEVGGAVPGVSISLSRDDEACLELREGSGRWEDRRCSERRVVVCELERGPTCGDGLQNQGEEGIDCGGPHCAACECGEGWAHFGGACYRSLGRRAAFSVARQLCLLEGPGSRLPIPRSSSDSALVFGLGGGGAWLAAAAESRDRGDLSDFAWSNRQPVAAVPGVAIEGAESSSGDKCMQVVEPAEWEVSDCEEAALVVCQRALSLSCSDGFRNQNESGVDCGPACNNTCPPPGPADVCGPGWVPFRGSCYKFFHRSDSWEAANSICESEGDGAHLPVIEHKSESSFVFEEGGAAWLGLSREKRSSSAVSDFTWVSGEQGAAVSGVQVTNTAAAAALCVEIRGLGEWRAQGCSQPAGVVCQRKLPPSCFDGIQNQGESGVDCGGAEWEACAAEGEACACATGEVRFGADGLFAYGNAAEEVACGEDQFGMVRGITSEWFDYRQQTSDTLPSSNPKFTVLVQTVDHKNSAPVKIGSTKYAARWTTYFEATADSLGEYLFKVKTDDGARLWVQDQLRINKWKQQGATTYATKYTVSAPGLYKVVLEYFQWGGGREIELRWRPPGGPEHVMGSRSDFPLSTPLPALPARRCECRTAAVCPAECPTAFACDQGWTEFQGVCFTFADDRMNHGAATEWCEERVATLPVVRSKAMSEFIYDKAGRDAWLGAKRVGSDDRSIQAYTWATGEPASQPSGMRLSIDYGNDRDCLIIDDDDRWKNKKCTDRYEVACQKPPSVPLYSKATSAPSEQLDTTPGSPTRPPSRTLFVVLAVGGGVLFALAAALVAVRLLRRTPVREAWATGIAMKDLAVADHGLVYKTSGEPPQILRADSAASAAALLNARGSVPGSQEPLFGSAPTSRVSSVETPSKEAEPEGDRDAAAAARTSGRTSPVVITV